jgi:hypothetical protein
MAETVILDGTASAVTNFGEYDSSGLFWTPKSSATIKALTFGTNGFYLDNTTNAQTDASGEGNNFTNNNTVVTSTHTPTNLFSLLNPLMSGSTGSFSDGNRTATLPPVNTSVISSMAIPSTGKWYCEFRFATIHGYAVIGVSQMDASSWLANSASYFSSTPAFTEEGTLFTQGTTSGDSITVTTDTTYGAMWDADNSILKITDGTDTFQCGFTVNDTSVPLGFQFAISSGSVTGNVSVNFGDPPFAISSSNTDGNGQGSFEFAPPSGYLALNTANLASSTTRTHSNLEEYFDSTLYEGNGTGQRVGKFLPFTNTFTVGKGALFINANSESLSRGSMSGTASTFTISMWVKRAEPAVGNTDANFVFTTASDAGLAFGNNSTADVLAWYSGSYTATTRVFSDQSQWINVVFKSSSGTGTAYVNGVEVLGSLTVPSADATMSIGSYLSSSNFFDGYMAEVVMIDGTALEPSSFGQVDTSTGRWIPKDVSGLTFGTNGFYLNFAASDDVGNDVSGNNNDFTNNNTVVQVGDTPTVNFGVLDSNFAVNVGFAITNGNKTNTGNSGSLYGNARTGLTFGNEKIFAMLLINDGGSGASVNTGFSVAPDSYVPDGNNGPHTGTYANVQTQGSVTRVVIGDAKGGTVTTLSHSIAVADGDYFTMAVDAANGAVWFGIYDTSAGSHQYLPAVVGGTAGNPALGTLPTVSNLPFNNSQSCIMSGGFGSGSSSTLVFDSGSMPMSLPTDYLEFKQDNLAEGESYQTAWSWIKNRDATDNHMLFDRVRGIYKDIHSNDMVAQVTNVNTLQRFLNGGVQVGNDAEVNTVNESYVAWNWYFETTGSGSSNTDGTINTTSTLVDTNIGLSISQYTGTGANATIGHGLGVVPEVILLKNLDNTGSTQWLVYHSAVGNTKAAFLDATTAFSASAGYFNNTTPTSSVFSVGNSTYGNESSKNHVAYCFAPSQFTSIGSYVGNGNANGTFIPTVNSLGVPIQPAWFMAKSIGSGQDWRIVDNKRNPSNVNNLHLRANTTAADTSETNLDIDTGGIKIRTSSGGWNTSGTTYVYLAFGTPLIDVDGRIITGF